MLNDENILGVSVSIFSYESLKEKVIDNIKNNKKCTIVAINPEKILKARKSKELKDLLNGATYRIPDGIGIIYASKFRGKKITERITGIDCMEMLCELASQNNYKVFLFGAKEDIVKKAKKKLEEKHKGLNIVGYINGYEKDNNKIIKTINDSKPDILFVALGSPKQESWINENMNKLNVKIFQGVGGSFDVFSGNIKRAPKWMQKMGLEWFYRLLKEPKRIGRQLKLFKFLYLVIVGRD